MHPVGAGLTEVGTPFPGPARVGNHAIHIDQTRGVKDCRLPSLPAQCCYKPAAVPRAVKPMRSACQSRFWCPTADLFETELTALGSAAPQSSDKSVRIAKRLRYQ